MKLWLNSVILCRFNTLNIVLGLHFINCHYFNIIINYFLLLE